MSFQSHPAFGPVGPVVQKGVNTANSRTISPTSTALSSLSLPKSDPLPTDSTATNPPTQSSEVTRPMTSASHFSKKHAVPIKITAPIVFSVCAGALVFYYYYRRKRKSRRMRLPDTMTHGGEDQIVRGMEGSLGRINILGPFLTSSVEPRNEPTRAVPFVGAGPTRPLESGKRQQAPELIPEIATEGDINPQQNVETIDRTGNGPQAQPQSLAEQVEALQERLRAMEETMNSERNLRQSVPPPPYMHHPPS